MDQLQGLLNGFISGHALAHWRHPFVHELTCGQRLTPAELRAGSLLILMSGELQLTPFDGAVAPQSRLNAGQAYCVDAESRDYLFIACDVSRVLILPESELLTLFREHPSLRNRLMDCLTGQMHDAEQIDHFHRVLSPGQRASGAGIVGQSIRGGLARLRAQAST